MKTTVRAKLVAIQDGLYTNYVFQNLDTESNNEYHYLTVTQCPGWQDYNLKQGDIGFLVYEFAEANKDYYDVSTNQMKKYKYTSNYFMNFIKEDKNKDENKKEYKF